MSILENNEMYEIDRLVAENERLTRERDEARDTARHMLKRAETAEGSTVSWMETAATVSARAEALEAALREVIPGGHYGRERYDAQCSEACRDDENGACDVHRPDIPDDGCDAHPTCDERDAVCVRCIGLDALTGTPPADLTQHPAYRDGYRAGVGAGIEEAARAVDYAADQWAQIAQVTRDATHKACAERFAEQADAIRALLDTKEVRDGE